MSTVLLRFAGDMKPLKDTLGDTGKALTRFEGSWRPIAGVMVGTSAAGAAAIGGIGAAAVGAAGAVAALSAGAVAAGAGVAAAFAGIGIAGALANDDLAARFTELGETAGEMAERIGESYVPVLSGFAKDVDAMLTGPIEDALTRGAERSLPIVESLLGQIPGIIEDVLPVIELLSEQGTPLVAALAGGVGPAVEQLSGFLLDFIPKANAASAVLGGQLLTAAREVAAAAGPLGEALYELGAPLLPQVIGAVADVLSRLLATITPVVPAVGAMGPGFDGVGAAFLRVVDAIGPLLVELVELAWVVGGELLDPVLNLTGALLESLAPAVDSLTPVLSVVTRILGDLIGFLEPAAPLIIGLGVAYAVWTAAQWAINIAMTANPIGLIIVGIGLLVAAIVWVATKTTWFQDAWRVTWNAVTDAARVAGDWITSKWNSVMGFFTGLPGRIRSISSGMWDGIKDAFRSALNWIIGKWNSLGFTLPSFSAFGQTIGGGRISTPDIPYFHAGGIVPGAPGTEVPAILQAGERVSPIRATGGSTGSDPVVIEVRSGGSAMDDLLVDVLARALRGRGVRVAGWTA